MLPISLLPARYLCHVKALVLTSYLEKKSKRRHNVTTMTHQCCCLILCFEMSEK